MRILIRPEAREDLRDASTWYADQAPGLGKRFLAAIREQLLQISASPDAFPLFHQRTRRALIRTFPYGIIDLVQPEQERIVVVAVLHCGRDPKLWRSRSQP
jgi:plasmid stabilization system protein ParE